MGSPFLWRRRRRRGGGGVGEGDVGSFWRVVGSLDSDRACCFCFVVFACRKDAFLFGNWGMKFSLSGRPLASASEPTATSQTREVKNAHPRGRGGCTSTISSWPSGTWSCTSSTRQVDETTDEVAHYVKLVHVGLKLHHTVL